MYIRMFIIKVIIYTFLLICLVKLLIRPFNSNRSLLVTQLGFILLALLCAFYFCQFVFQTRRNIIEFQPVEITMEYVIRIPLEDQIDLDLEDQHNVHNKTLKRGAIQSIEQLRQSDRQQYTISTAFDQINHV